MNGSTKYKMSDQQLSQLDKIEDLVAKKVFKATEEMISQLVKEELESLKAKDAEFQELLNK